MVEKEIIRMVKDIKKYEEGQEISLKDKNFFEDFQFDSVDIMELLVRIEERFSVDLASVEIMSILNDCNKLIYYLEKTVVR